MSKNDDGSQALYQTNGQDETFDWFFFLNLREGKLKKYYGYPG